MNQEEWDELLELRKKASLTPQEGDYRFKRLEEYISAANYLSSFTEEETSRLWAEFNKLPHEKQQAILSRALYKTQTSFFHLTHEEVEKLQSARPKLSLHERARLFSGLILTAAGTAWLDLGNVFEAVIEIDDESSPERETRPFAYISYEHNFDKRAETIDILESVRQNPTSVGHPVIVFAIQYWQRVIHAKRVLERDDVTSLGEFGKAFKYAFGGLREVRIAERNLEEISKALVSGAKDNALSKEVAFAVKVELMALGSESKESYLYEAWGN